MHLLDYLEQFFYREDQLCQHLGIDREQLEHWQHLCIFPHASYSLENSIQCHSVQGIYDCQVFWQYYPIAMQDWGRQISKANIDSASVAFNLFAQRAMQALNYLQSEGLYLVDDYLDDIGERLTHLWQQFLSGQFGTQTRQGQIEEIIQMDALRYSIDTLTEGMTITTLSAEQRQQLHPLMKQFSKAVIEPPGHEYQHSLRAKYLDALVLKYDLSLKR
ncbi:DUF6058 family natural product biosynthesis protein [Pseudoalteromonas sp. T1lg75]|uniref:DUF6058 family natural product biosynthesis protein n=1 Tax=Pseudoalteromonas sp. T1lg75 TaxID=2077102 RepID=UPI000CF64E28|nr:DUF6058 family natural product biosynthesis protein [Pseudoalteromonas sp. T1lg75]